MVNFKSRECAIRQAEKDLSELLDTKVTIFGTDNEYQHIVAQPLEHATIINPEKRVEKFQEDPELLTEVQRMSSVLAKNSWYKYTNFRSNCKVTHQPDYATVFIYSSSPMPMDGVARYLASFRDESHFHEECVEMIYDRLYKKYQPEDLVVFAQYTRRGGIDINPYRASSFELLAKVVPSGFISRTTQQ